MLEQGRTNGKKLKTSSLVLDLQNASRDLSLGLNKLKKPKDVFIYNPLDYAETSYFQYIARYAQAPLEGLFLGMNPGPFGMMQTGIPFGDVISVKNFLKIQEGVQKPFRQHPKRPIEGFACSRVEVSGSRLWTLFEKKYSTADKFFKKFFVFNYCPLGFLSEKGSNVTPDKLEIQYRKAVEKLCDEHLSKAVEILKPQKLFGIGAYAAKIFQRLFPEMETHTILHPSPASPAANKGWDKIAHQQLKEAGIKDFA
ncbi:MAG: uracil-DNA glycosylase family protein [bacterium]